ncbi:unnamed protein product [Absidia cylindrospora]
MAYYGSIVKQKQTNHLTKAERYLLQSDRPGYGTRSKIEVAFNLVNATIGAGIIGLPFAIAHTGFILGVFISIFVAILSQVGLYMVVLAGQRVKVYKFALLVEYLLGRAGYHFLNLMILSKPVVPALVILFCLAIRYPFYYNHTCLNSKQSLLEQ